MLARKLQRFSGQVPITSPNHPNLSMMFTGDNISGPTVFDESPNGRNATINGSVSAVAGKVGNALDFGGASGDYLASSYDFFPEIKSGDFAIALWLNPDALNTDNYLMGSTPFASAESGFTLSVKSTGELIFGIARGVGGSFTIILSTVGAGVTTGAYFLVIVNGTAATGAEIFVNNVSRGAGAYANPLPTGASTRALNIGRANHSSVFNPFNGKEDEIRFFDRPLTAAERSALWNGGTGA